MQIRLYSGFVKRTDSTKQPTGNYITKDVQFKAATSISNPTFILSGFNYSYNYVYVPAWNRYYFISDVRLGNTELFEISCTCDRLASFRDSIRALNVYVERAASNYDPLINDPMLTQEQYIVHESASKTTFDGAFVPAGCYIVRTKASSSNSETGINSYALTKGQLGIFLNDAFNTGNYGDVFTEVADEIIKAVFNPLDYIISVCWVPFNAETISNNTQTDNIKLGWWSCPNAEGYKMKASAYSFNTDIVLPNSYFNDWRDYNPNYTDVKMLIPCVGLVDFDAMQMCYPDDTTVKLNILYSIDCSTGEGEVFLRNINSEGKIVTVAKYKANTCSNIQIAQTSFNLTGSLSDTVTALGGAMSGNVPLTITSGVSAIANILKPNTSSMGVNGSRTSINNYLDVHVYVQHYGCAEYPNTKGRPLCKNVLLSTLSGYVQCAGASINNIANYDTDKDIINTYLNGGFYME